MQSSETTIWNLPDYSAMKEGAGRSRDDIEKFSKLLPRVIEIAQRKGWTKSETGERIGMKEGTFSQWASGKYGGRYDGFNEQVENWISQVAEMEAVANTIPTAPAFLRTEFSKKMMDMLAVAQLFPALVTIAAEAGNGKTFTAEHFIKIQAHAYLVTMTSFTKTPTAMLQAIADALGISTTHQVQPLAKLIGQRLKRAGGGTLVIIDECQHLSNEAINGLRSFLDLYNCGIALVGNSEVYSRFSSDWSSGPKFGQLHRRVLKRMKQDQPSQRDLDLFIESWGVKDRESKTYLSGLGRKPGTLGQINQTMRVAKMTALGAGREVTLGDIKAAMTNRGLEL
jgi:DNA transposition AAA+ family ATPase